MSVGGFFHGGITVADMDRSLSFYVDGLERHFAAARPCDPGVAHLGFYIELFQRPAG